MTTSTQPAVAVGMHLTQELCTRVLSHLPTITDRLSPAQRQQVVRDVLARRPQLHYHTGTEMAVLIQHLLGQLAPEAAGTVVPAGALERYADVRAGDAFTTQQLHQLAFQAASHLTVPLNLLRDGIALETARLVRALETHEAQLAEAPAAPPALQVVPVAWARCDEPGVRLAAIEHCRSHSPVYREGTVPTATSLHILLDTAQRRAAAPLPSLPRAAFEQLAGALAGEDKALRQALHLSATQAGITGFIVDVASALRGQTGAENRELVAGLRLLEERHRLAERLLERDWTPVVGEAAAGTVRALAERLHDACLFLTGAADMARTLRYRESLVLGRAGTEVYVQAPLWQAYTQAGGSGEAVDHHVHWLESRRSWIPAAGLRQADLEQQHGAVEAFHQERLATARQAHATSTLLYRQQALRQVLREHSQRDPLPGVPEAQLRARTEGLIERAAVRVCGAGVSPYTVITEYLVERRAHPQLSALQRALANEVQAALESGQVTEADRQLVLCRGVLEVLYAHLAGYARTVH